MKPYRVPMLLTIVLAILVAVTATAAALIPNSATVEKLDVATSPDHILIEIVLPNDTKVLMAMLPVEDDAADASGDDADALLEKLGLPASPVNLDDYEYLYYDQVDASGKKINSRIYSLETASWLEVKLPAMEPHDAAANAQTYEVGPYLIEVTGVSLVNDWLGESITLNFSFTNNSRETKSVLWALDYKAFQNGVELDSMSGENILKDVKPGATLKNVSIGFEPTDESAVTFELKESFAYDVDPIEMTFDFP